MGKHSPPPDGRPAAARPGCPCLGLRDQREGQRFCTGLLPDPRGSGLPFLRAPHTRLPLALLSIPSPSRWALCPDPFPGWGATGCPASDLARGSFWGL